MKRFFWLGAVILTFALGTDAADAQVRVPRPGPVVDAATVAILAAPLQTIDAGAARGVDPSPAIHRNFPQIVEQNFARLDAAGAARLIANLTDREASDLAQLYTTATRDAGRQGRLLDVLANRLDASHLAKVAQHFGYLPVQEAVARAAPAKLSAFTQLANVSSVAPTYGGVVSSATPTLTAMAGAGVMVPNAGVGQWLNYTPYEIYLSLRTAPVGSLGVAGALYETAAIVGVVWKQAAWGYAAGTIVAQLLQTYAPSTWDAIGGTISGMADQLTSAVSLYSQGQIEAGTLAAFGLDPSINLSPAANDSMTSSGGDYGSTQGLPTFTGGGGGAPLPPKPISLR